MTIVTKSPKTVGKIWHDEGVGFKIDDYLVIYYLAKDKFLARVIRDGPSDAEMPELLP